MIAFPSFREFQASVLESINREQLAIPNRIEVVVQSVTLLGSPQGQSFNVEGTVAGFKVSASDVAGRFKNAKVSLPSGRAEVSSIEAEDRSTLQLTLTGKGLDDIQPGTRFELSAIDYFMPLNTVWKNPDIAQRIYERFVAMMKPGFVSELGLIDSAIVQGLLPAQRQALTLANHNYGWEEGPPGTGKTYTNAVMLASILTVHPEARILVVSTTNYAVNDLLLRLDEVMQAHELHELEGTIARYGKTCPLPHFLPKWGDPLQPGYGFGEDLFDETPLPQAPPRLCAMTIHSALMRFNKLRQGPQFSLVLIEEASQTSLAHIMPLTTLAKRSVFVGDPAQLSPVAKFKSGPHPRFMADSPFLFSPKDTKSDCLVMLNEQQRMPPSICKFISDASYQGKLVTATSCLTDERWLRSRSFMFDTIPADAHMVLSMLPSEPASRPVTSRLSSAEAIIRLIKRAIAKGADPASILVITPFNKQVALIRKLMRSDTYLFGKVKVSTVLGAQKEIEKMTVATVYSSQGKERNVVIFDPVDGGHWYLTQEESLQLLTVSFSRAKAKLIMFASEKDLQHPFLEKFRQYTEHFYEDYSAVADNLRTADLLV